MKRCLTIIILCSITLQTFGQTLKIDSLKRLIYLAKSDRQRLTALIIFCEEHESLNPDTLLTYATRAQKLAKSQNNKLLQLESRYFLTISALRKSLPDSILNVCNECINHLSKMDSGEALWYKFSFLKVRILMTGRKYQEAMKEDYKLLKKTEQARDTTRILMSKLSIGFVHMELGQHASAITWFRNALQTTKNLSILNRFSVMYGDIAAEYINTRKPDSAAYFIKEAFRTARQWQDLSHIANTLFIQSDLFILQKNTIAAEKNMLEAISIRKLIGDPYFILSDMADLAAFYASTKQYNKGTALANNGIALAIKTKVTSKLPMLYNSLAINYKAAGDYRHYAETLNRLLVLKDSIYQKNSVDALAELETKYQVQKKEATIAEQRLRLVKDSYLFWGAVLLSVLSGIIIWLIFRDYRRKQRIKIRLLQDKEKRFATQAVADAEENERKRIAADLHDNLGAQLSFIKRNVNYIIDQPRGFNKSDEKKYLGYIKDITQNAMVDLRETIWVLNKEEVGIQEFVDKLNSYVGQQLMDKDGIRWEFEQSIGQGWMLSSSEVMHLFRVVQEIISNSVKHAQGDKIDIKFTSDIPGTYELTIGDNGLGFNICQEFKDHYGLENISRRVELIHAVLTVKSEIGNGTIITVNKGQNSSLALFNATVAASNFIT